MPDYLLGVMMGESPDGGSDILCMPSEPFHQKIEKSPSSGVSMIAPYATLVNLENNATQSSPTSQTAVLPCAQCFVESRVTTMMIPGWKTCPKEWHEEYYGYLMTSQSDSSSRTYKCVDKDMEYVDFDSDVLSVLTFVHQVCGSVKPDYTVCSHGSKLQLSCVVCSR